MKRTSYKLWLACFTGLLVVAVSASAQIYRYYTNGSIWTVTTVRIKSGMDPAYLQHLAGPFKKEHDAKPAGLLTMLSSTLIRMRLPNG